MPLPCQLPLLYALAKKPFFPKTSMCSSLFETLGPQSIQIILVHLGLSLVDPVLGPSFTCLGPNDKTSRVALKFETSEFNSALLGSMLSVISLSLPFLEIVTS